MEPTHSQTDALRQAQARLSEWKPRVANARNLAGQLDAARKREIEPFLQELKDRCDQAENAVILLHQCEAKAVQPAVHPTDAVHRSFSQLARTWVAVERALRPVAACPQARQGTWPF